MDPVADCACPWKGSATPCLAHSHHRRAISGPWECFMHNHGHPALVEDQPAPVPNDDVAVWDLVIADMQTRDHVGRERYGTPPQVDNGRDHLVDAYQEALDLVVYLRAEIERRAERGSGR